MKKKFGIIGNPIKHSLSPVLHKYWFDKYGLDASYSIIEAKDEDLKDIVKKIRSHELIGINVTVPFKQKIINQTDKIVNDAELTGSVNTILLDNDKIVGENTDVFGLQAAYLKEIDSSINKSALIIGAGGVSPSVILSLQKSGIKEISIINFDHNDVIRHPLVTKIVEAIISNTSLTLSSAVGGSDVSTKTVATRNRGKLQDPSKNISIFKLPNDAVKTLKTTSNSGITDTNFKVRRQFVQQLSSGSGQISAGTNETFASLAEGDYVVSIKAIGSASLGANGDILSLTGTNAQGGTVFTLGGSPTGKTLTFDFGTGYADAELMIVATVNRSVAGSKTKTLNSNE